MSQEQDIFISALDVEPEERAQYLRRACGSDATLIQAVESLLDANEKIGDFLDVPALEQLNSTNASDSSRAAELLFLSPSTDDKSLGRLDRYEILEIVGRGGMAIVMRARDTKLQRDVAIKVLVASGVARQNFVQEAQAIAAIRDEHVVTIHSVEDQGPVPYLVMEYIDGGTLESLLRETGVPGLAQILTFAEQIASGLSAIHRRGLVHRDVKPGNMLIETETRRIKISDFGIASESQNSGTPQSEFLVGTPNYMSPEQAKGIPVYCRSDLFSLGSVLYELCTGQRPFHAVSTLSILRGVIQDPHRPVRELNPAIPSKLSRLIDSLLAKTPEDRPASADQVAIQLRQIRDEEIPNTTEGAQSAKGITRTDGTSLLSAGWRRFAVAVGLLAVGVGFSEAAGLTNLQALVVRVTSPKGNLVVEIEDPDATVSIDGTELKLTGAGTHSVELTAGEYKLNTERDSGTETETITIERQGNRVVRVRREAPPKPQTAAAGLSFRQAFIGHLAPITSLTFSVDGKLLASADQVGEVRVWNVAEGSLRYFLPPLNAPVAALAFSPDGRFLVTAGSGEKEDADCAIHVWDATTGESQGRLEKHHRGIFDLSFSSDGTTLLSAGWDGQLVFWNFPAREVLRTIPSPGNDWIRSASFSPNGRIAVASANSLFLIQPDGQTSAPMPTGKGPIGTFSRDGKRLVAAEWRDGSVKVWDAESKQRIGQWRAHSSQINAADFSTDHRILGTVGNDGAIRLWDVDRQKMLAEVISESKVYWLEFSPDGKTLATGGLDDQLVKLWDVSLPEPAAAPPAQK